MRLCTLEAQGWLLLSCPEPLDHQKQCQLARLAGIQVEVAEEEVEEEESQQNDKLGMRRQNSIKTQEVFSTVSAFVIKIFQKKDRTTAQLSLVRYCVTKTASVQKFGACLEGRPLVV